MTTKPGQYDITIIQGATLSLQLTYQDADGVAINLTGYTARLQARTAVDTSAAFLDLTTENGGITLGGSAGTITISRTAAQTAAMTEQSGVYDLELITGSTVSRILAGNIIVSREVTR